MGGVTCQVCRGLGKLDVSGFVNPFTETAKDAAERAQLELCHGSGTTGRIVCSECGGVRIVEKQLDVPYESSGPETNRPFSETERRLWTPIRFA
jgi:hypothetical protein